MFRKLSALMESEDTQRLISENEELILEATEVANDFSKVLKNFTLEHPEEFLGENTEETYKNIRLFSEVATSQFMTELTHLCGSVIPEPLQEAKVDDYL